MANSTPCAPPVTNAVLPLINSAIGPLLSSSFQLAGGVAPSAIVIGSDLRKGIVGHRLHRSIGCRSVLQPDSSLYDIAVIDCDRQTDVFAS